MSKEDLKIRALEVRDEVVEGRNTAGRVGQLLVDMIEGGSNVEIIESSELGTILSSDDSVYSSFSTDIRIIEELEGFLDEIDTRYLRKDIDDKAFGNIDFDKNIFVKGEAALTDTLVIEAIYSDSEANDFEAKGFYVNKDGEAWFGDLKAKGDSMFAGNLSSPVFVSGFPAGTGWALIWREIVNAAGVAAKKAHLEIDDLTVRGILRVYEMVISQLLGENGTHLTTDMMKVKSVDVEKRIIYLDTEEGELYNPFWTDDILMVQIFNGMPTPENDYYVTKQYEFVVEETHIGGLDDGENRVDWIKFKNFVGNLEDLKERDTLVRVDNLTNSDRKGLIKQTSVEPGSPYMDVIYGMKTDPENAVKTRVGKLEGLITPYWGQLQKYGIMCDNFYGKGHFMLHTGEDVKTKFEIVEGKLYSEMSSIRAEISEKENFLKNASFSLNTLFWVLGNDVSLFTINQKFLGINNNFYADKKKLTGVVEVSNRKALRIKNSEIKQLNADIRFKPEEQLELEDGTKHWPTYYVSFMYQVNEKGTLTSGFTGQPLFISEELDATEIFETKEFSGAWDGTGDFVIAFTGDICIYNVTLYNKPLKDIELKMNTKFIQTDRLIQLLGEKTDELNGIQVNMGIELDVLDEQIKLYINKTNALEGTTTQLGIDIDGVDERLSLYANKTDSIQGIVTQLGIDLDVAEESIGIWAGRVTDVEGRVDNVEYSVVTVLPEGIEAVSKRVTDLGVAQAGFITSSEAAGLFASKEDIEGDKIVGYINVQPGNIKISAKNIELDGRTIADAIEANDISTGRLTVTDGAKIGGFVIDTVDLYSRDGAGIAMTQNGDYCNLNYSTGHMIYVVTDSDNAIFASTERGNAIYATCRSSGYALTTIGNIQHLLSGSNSMSLSGIRDNENQNVEYSGDVCVHFDGKRKILMIQ